MASHQNFETIEEPLSKNYKSSRELVQAYLQRQMEREHEEYLLRQKLRAKWRDTDRRDQLKEEPSYWRQDNNVKPLAVHTDEKITTIETTHPTQGEESLNCFTNFKSKLSNKTMATVSDLQEHLTICNAVLVLLLNLLLPGIGTIISATYVTTRRVLALQKRQTNHEKRVKTSIYHHVKQIKRRARILGIL